MLFTYIINFTERTKNNEKYRKQNTTKKLQILPDLLSKKRKYDITKVQKWDEKNPVPNVPIRRR